MPRGASSFHRGSSHESRPAVRREPRAESGRPMMLQRNVIPLKWHAALGLSSLLMLAFVTVSAQTPQRKRLLALADTHTGYTHDSIGHALAVVEHLGRQSGL